MMSYFLASSFFGVIVGRAMVGSHHLPSCCEAGLAATVLAQKEKVLTAALNAAKHKHKHCMSDMPRVTSKQNIAKLFVVADPSVVQSHFWPEHLLPGNSSLPTAVSTLDAVHSAIRPDPVSPVRVSKLRAVGHHPDTSSNPLSGEVHQGAGRDAGSGEPHTTLLSCMALRSYHDCQTQLILHTPFAIKT